MCFEFGCLHSLSASSASDSASLVDQLRNANIISDDDTVDQNAPNENILQLVAQIPNHPLQKFAQKLLVDRPKATSESHSKSASGETTPPKHNSPTASTSKSLLVYKLIDNKKHFDFESCLVLKEFCNIIIGIEQFFFEFF